ncbi:hypothetical protein ILYODFUR_022924 [Ilyodon furcidens]|uniref:Uncharacterized protein n=1 Tax=Ilyodon furcidens TaxID=33524 RepID=A0ABV0TAD6_9TELE
MISSSEQCLCMKTTSGSEKWWFLETCSDHSRCNVVDDGEGSSPEVHSHLHSLEWVKLQVVLTATADLIHLLSICRHVIVLDQTSDSGVICTTGAGADGSCAREDVPQPHLLLLVSQEVDDPLTGGGWHCKLGELLVEVVCVDGVVEDVEGQTKVYNQDPGVHL